MDAEVDALAGDAPDQVAGITLVNSIFMRHHLLNGLDRHANSLRNPGSTIGCVGL